MSASSSISSSRRAFSPYIERCPGPPNDHRRRVGWQRRWPGPIQKYDITSPEDKVEAPRRRQTYLEKRELSALPVQMTTKESISTPRSYSKHLGDQRDPSLRSG
jgi:hypothetical protein